MVHSSMNRRKLDSRTLLFNYIMTFSLPLSTLLAFFFFTSNMPSNKLAIATVSLSQHPAHSLDKKVRVAAQHGYAGVEVVYSDLDAYSRAQGTSMLEGAAKIRSICDEIQLEILSLAPFENYEGDPSPLEDRLKRANHWLDIARTLGAPCLQIPSHYGQDCDGDFKVIISDLQRLADLGRSEQPSVSIAYEALSWGTHVSTLQSCFRVVEAVRRPNFGLCLDTFHVVTKVWGDPFSRSGMYENADRELHDTLRRFADECPLEKIFYVQLSDGERFDPPFSKNHPWYLEGEAPQFTWSKHARPFPLEKELGGYMPVCEIARAWIGEMGFTGWVSLEAFDRRMRDENILPEMAAARGIESWRKVQADIRAPGSKM